MCVFTFKKSFLISLVCFFLLFAVVGVYTFNGVYSAAMSYGKDLPVYSVETNEKKLCITFDAAWDEDNTDELLAVLKKYGAKATFFAVGTWAQKYPESVKKIAEASHCVGSHSYNHTLYTKLNKNEIMDDIAACNEELAAITKKNPSLVRVPSGDYDSRVIKTVYSLGLYPIQSDVDSLDYTGLSKEQIVNRGLPNVKNGSIILFHTSVKNTVTALDEILSVLQKDGWQFVTVEELILKDNFTFDHEGRQIKA